MGRREKKKKRRVFTLYNLIVLICIIVILGSAYILFDLEDEVSGFIASAKETIENFIQKEDDTSNNITNRNTTNNAEVNSTNDKNISKNESADTPNSTEEVNSNSGITENEARNIAILKFNELGESNINNEDLGVKKIRRSGEEYYYISSKENTLEVKIETGQITRINSVVVNN